MNKKSAILISVVAVLAVAIGVVGFYMGYTSFERKAEDNDRNDTDRTTIHSDFNTAPSEDNGFPDGIQGDSQSGNQGNTQGGSVQSGDLASQLIGRWRDGAGMSGFEFKADGKAVLTYIDLGFTGIDIFNGDIAGVYTLEGDKLTVSTSVYAGTISISYTASVSDNVLTLVSTDDGSVLTYMRSEDTDTDVGGDVSIPQPDGGEYGLIGVWSDGAGMSGYEFKEDGTLSFTFINLEFLGYEDASGSYPGVYSVNGDEIKISFSVYGATISNKYTYKVDGSMLTLTSEDGTVTTYMKK